MCLVGRYGESLALPVFVDIESSTKTNRMVVFFRFPLYNDNDCGLPHFYIHFIFTILVHKEVIHELVEFFHRVTHGLVD